MLGGLIRSWWQYIDALRFGNLARFKDIEEEAGDWWFPTLDRGAGAALHFAAESGQVPQTLAMRHFHSKHNSSHFIPDYMYEHDHS